jgi:hypothetical protein
MEGIAYRLLHCLEPLELPQFKQVNVQRIACST